MYIIYYYICTYILILIYVHHNTYKFVQININIFNLQFCGMPVLNGRSDFRKDRRPWTEKLMDEGTDDRKDGRANARNIMTACIIWTSHWFIRQP